MTVEGETTRNPEEAAGLRRELRFWEAIALSIAIMAPTAAMALNGTLPAGRLVVVSGAGHGLPREAPEAVSAAIARG